MFKEFSCCTRTVIIAYMCRNNRIEQEALPKTGLVDLERSSTSLSLGEDSLAAPGSKAHEPTSMKRGLTAKLAGHAQNDTMLEEASTKNPGTPKQKRNEEREQEEEEDDDSENYRKLYNRMDAKLRRMCEPKAKSGKIDAEPALVADWKKKGHTRTQLVKLMIEAQGDKDCICNGHVHNGKHSHVVTYMHVCVGSVPEPQNVFEHKLKAYRKTEQFRKLSTKGGWYSEGDMRKKVSEGGLAFSAPFCSNVLCTCTDQFLCIVVGPHDPETYLRRKVMKVKEFCEKNGLVR